MKDLSLRTLFTGNIGNCVRIKARVLFIVLLLCAGIKGYSAGVNVTPASGGTNICSSKAVGGSAPAYTTLGNIIVTETNNADLAGPGTDVLVLSTPAGWQFNTAITPVVSYITGSNITSISVFTITPTSVTINIVTNGTNGSDQFTISGLQVQATSVSSAAGYIYPLSVVGIAGLTTGIAGTNFGNLSLATPLTPSVTIAASPTGSICPGTNVLFTPTPVNGGASPAYQWYLNGTSVVTGATYANNSLANGNTISCTMTASGSCLTTTTAVSNTYTVTVTPGPLPVNGATITCPGTTITLSDNTTGGTWSSSNTTIATTDASGNVTGVSVGTATISYMAGGCPSTINITVNNSPLAPVLTTTLTTMCSGDVTVITSTGIPLPSTVLSQNFNAGISPWTADNSGSIGTLTGSGWKVCGDGYINEQGLYHSPDNSSFVMANSDTSGSSSITSSKLISPVFSLADYSGATLTFQQAYEYWPAGDSSVSVQISTDGGTTWNTLQNYVGANVGNRTGFVSETFSLNAYLGQTNLALRFNYYCHWGYYWAVDDILITGTSSIVIPVWSPATYLFTDIGCTTPYTTGTALSTVYVHPSSITTTGSVTYTATATSTGCAATNTSTFNFNPTPSPITGTGSICAGAITNLTDITAGGTWSSSNTAIATVASGTGAVTGIAGGTATITYAFSTGCYATTTVTVNSLPATISGARGVCIGNTTNLTDASAGGSWVSSNPAVATIGSGTGLVTSVAAGTTYITYTLGTGCSTIITETVNPLPSAINGNTHVCAGSSMSLSDPDGGGTWSSGSTSIAFIGSNTGTVIGVTAGNTTITYTLGTGCSITMQMTVNPIAAISGITSVCALSAVTLSDSYTGGIWSSNNTTVATAGSSSGGITGVAGGVTIITYTLPTGCMATTAFTVNQLPANITGNTEVCAGLNTNLSDAITGGVWSSLSTAIATVGSSSGIVHGVAQGNVVIKYSLSTGCFITTTVTVDPLPAAISGNTTVCAGSSVTISDATTGGTWSSGNPIIATAGSTTGTITGLSAGTTVITYTLSTGCIATTNFTVNPLPASITGITEVCTGLTTNLSDATSFGAWSSSNTSVANIGVVSGIVTGVTFGTASITYTLGTGCFITITVTVDPLPGLISGNAAVCNGLSTTLSDTPTGGVWSSGAPSVARIGSSTGIITALSTGTAMITYTLATGCIATKIATVNPLPGTINGTTAVCQGSTTSLSNASAGGIWSSSNTAVGSIGTTGVVTGISAGTTGITYTLGTGCLTAVTVTVSALPNAITGANNICQGASTTLSDATPGGTWSSSNTGSAIVGSSTGNVTGLATGTANIIYTIHVAGGIGCSIATTITVNPIPANISGASSVCTGASINLTDVTTGGSWSSSNTSTATIGSTGILAGVVAGAVTITYALPTGCLATKTIFVNQTPAVVSGVLNVCQGATTGLSDLYAGGTWTSSNLSIATIGSATGIVNGLSAGTSNITYTLSGGCNTASVVTVNLSPADISGLAAICAGATINLSNTITGGTWSSNNTSVAVIGSSSGFVNSLTAGTTIITYALSDGCTTDTTLTVNVMPLPINGMLKLCIGATSALSDNVTGGSWSSSNISVAHIGSTGIINAFSAGTTIITYGFATGCMVTAIVTVNIVPGSISGTASICFGFTTTLTDVTSGGVWTSSNTSVATVGTGSGIVTTVAPGSTIIYYTLPTGCAVSRRIFVNPEPSVIDGTTNICAGTVTILTDSIGGGTWSSGNTAIATIGTSTGALTGVGSGTVMISYSLGAGCIATTLVTVNLLPSSIAGSSALCAGATITLSDPIGGGGTWSSSNTSVATIGSFTGVISGINAGTTTITYSLGVGCTLATIITVNPLPSGIIETSNLCYGSNVTLSDSTMGGIWSSSNTAIARIGSSTGIISGIATGTTIITYNLSTGCNTTTTVTVYPLPPSISGTTTICAGLTATMSDLTTGGIWVSGSVGIAMIGSATGVVNAIGSGTTIISYILGTGCYTDIVITVNPLPTAIFGNSHVCAGLTTSMNDTTSGGAWSSSNTSVATIGASSGVINGITAGTSNITYTLATGCISTIIVTVYPLPASITGTLTVCPGLTTDLSDVTAGGVWNSNDVSIATINSSTGIVTGVYAGTTTITYTVTITGCIAVTNITVNPLPAMINGAGGLCIGLATTLSDDTSGGVWSSSAPLIASVGSMTGHVTGIAAGTAIITYTLPTGCIQTTAITVFSLPSVITGTKTICAGLTTILADSVTGGTWSSAEAPGIVTVAPTTGIITAVSTGTATITYTVSTGCAITTIVTVNPLPAAINGMLQVCTGFTISLSDPTPGGTWTSSVTSVAIIGSGTGIVTGIIPGVTEITYTLTTGCITSMWVTVNSLPATITGITQVCAGLTTTLSDVSPGGIWNISGSPGIASIDSFTGVVTGISAGTTIITYTIGTGCFITTVLTVNPLPITITGAPAVCVGLNTNLTDVTTGGNWSSGNPLIASVGSSTGIVTGLSAGGAMITYTLLTGCITTISVTVNPLPAVITGPLTVCVGLSNTLSDANPGGTWCSGSPGIAIVGSGTGIVTGIAAGTAKITYTLSTGCITFITITVNPLPAAINGTMNVCAGLTISLTDATVGGAWSIGSPGAGSINSSGVVTGITAGTSVVTYQLPTSCLVTQTITVNPLPATITGNAAICAGSTTTLSDVTSGGHWSVAGTGTASVGSTTGIVTGLSAGTAIITYTLSTGCLTTMTETVFTSPLPISGSNAVCSGSTISLTDAPAAGIWTSNNVTIASIGSATGILTGINAGTTIITYALGTGCISVITITVNPLPASITGTTIICTGHTSVLSDAVIGGIWSRDPGSSGIVTIGSTSGFVTALTSGSASVTYTLSTGCYVTTHFIVNPSPASITGITNVCAGLNTTLSDITPGGTWSSSNMVIATVGTSSGIVSGLSAGSVTISYILSTGCYAITTYTVNPLPSVISGNRSVCIGSTSVLSDGITGGIWSISGSASIATIGSASGIVNGINLGTATVTYTLPTGCTTNTVITVNPYPVAITGLSSVCQGAIIYMSDVTAGGVWSSSNVAIGSVSATSGVVTGKGGGSVTISYTLPTGCYVIKAVTVNPIFPITGSNNICAGATSVYSDVTSGGTWSSNNTTVATISPATGNAIAITSGTTIFSYTLGTGCVTSLLVTVNSIPASFYVIDGGSYCPGSSGAIVGLNGSDTGINYQLYKGTSLITSKAGNDSAIYFGPYTSPGTYFITAVNILTGCSNRMADSAIISIAPVLVPSVSISTGTGDTVCAGANVTFTALPVNGGSSPTYRWYVNGAHVTASGSSYHFIPLTGDLVSVVLTSNAACVLPDTARNSMTVITKPNLLPSVSITAFPGDTLCAHTTATMIPAPVNGGTLPLYRWVKNGTTAGWGSTYNFSPGNGDNVFCVLHSDYQCLITDTANSNNINFRVIPTLLPTVTINAMPGTNISPGENDTLIAVVSHGGAGITYQWEINSITIPGATSDTFIYNGFVNNDTVNCIVTSNNLCGSSVVTASIIINVYNVGVTQTASADYNFILLPNPNNGRFVITGSTNSMVNETITIEITDMVGHIILEKDIPALNGNINEDIYLNNTLSNGMYQLRLFENTSIHSSGLNKVLYFVIRK